MKKALTALLTTALIFFTGCGAYNTEISVYSREDGSGTRSAFIELFGIEQKFDNGYRKDLTTKEASVTNNTEVVLTSVSKNKNAIGYVSLGSLNNTVKTLKVDGAEATAQNIKSGAYKVARPFNIVVTGNRSELAQDFIDFMLSKEGQEVVSNSYISVNDNANEYSGSKPSGKIVVGGSSSVAPIMEKLKEAYNAVNTVAEIEIQLFDSTSGITSTISGTFDIGMVSRTLTASEQELVSPTTIALDGIAVIVSKENKNDSLTHEQIKKIFTGETLNWSELE